MIMDCATNAYEMIDRCKLFLIISKKVNGGFMKHAFLIMAHKNTESFQTLLRQIDHEKVDIFIHMDRKNKDYNIELTTDVIKRAHVFHTQRLDVSWGGFSQIVAELTLLKLATSKGHYDYYHLLSGQDLLITSLEDFFVFFKDHQGIEFVNFESNFFKHENRVKYYSLQDNIGRNRYMKPLKLINKFSMAIQQKLNINRNAGVSFQKGDNWFSITDDLARYVISKEGWIYSTFKYTEMADEVFLQTIVHNSPFKNKLFLEKYDNNYFNILRKIDWNRGMPYTFRSEDFGELIDSPCLFARKFDENVDDKIIKEISEYYQ